MAAGASCAAEIGAEFLTLHAFLLGGTMTTETTKTLAEKALCYVQFHYTELGVGFSFDATKYAKEVLEPAMKTVKKCKS